MSDTHEAQSREPKLQSPSGIVICRQASDPRLPGYVTGYSCKVCGKGLQVGPVAREGIESHGLMPLCNPCGFEMQRRLDKAGVSHEMRFSPKAKQQLEEILQQAQRQHKG